MSLIGEVSAREELARRDSLDAQKYAYKVGAQHGGLAAQASNRDYYVDRAYELARNPGYLPAYTQGVPSGSGARGQLLDVQNRPIEGPLPRADVDYNAYSAAVMDANSAMDSRDSLAAKYALAEQAAMEDRAGRLSVNPEGLAGLLHKEQLASDRGYNLADAELDAAIGKDINSIYGNRDVISDPKFAAELQDMYGNLGPN